MSAIPPVRPHRRGVLAGGLAALPALAWTTPARAEAERVVILGGALTEIAYDLGAQGRIAAVDTTSVYPAEALREKPNVGYLRQLSAEGILSVRPDLLLAIEGAGPPDVLKLVGEAGIRIVSVPDLPTEAGVLDRIEAVASALTLQEKGRTLTATVRGHFTELASLRARIRTEVRGLFILSLQNGRTMVGGRDTTADGMLRLAGIGNAAAAILGYKQMTDEAIVAARPDIVVMMAAGPGGAPPADLFEGPALSQTPAASGKRLVAMNGLYLLGFGPRTPEAARDLILAAYPALRGS